MPERADLTGQRFGRLVAREPVKVGRYWRWRCDCDCGGTITPRVAALMNGRKGKPGGATSCGCARREAAAAQAANHLIPDTEYTCGQCGRTFFARANKSRRYCGLECSRAAALNPAPSPRNCTVCGTPFTPEQRRGSVKKKRCSPECVRIDLARRNYRNRNPEIAAAEAAKTMEARP